MGDLLKELLLAHVVDAPPVGNTLVGLAPPAKADVVSRASGGDPDLHAGTPAVETEDLLIAFRVSVAQIAQGADQILSFHHFRPDAGEMRHGAPPSPSRLAVSFYRQPHSEQLQGRAEPDGRGPRRLVPRHSLRRGPGR